MNWKIPDGSDECLMLGLGKVFENEEAASPGLFPDLRKDEELVIACDYSGEHRQSDFNVFTFLLSDISSLQVWEERRLAIRREFLSDGRRLAFKKLSDARRQGAFYSFLKAAASLNGILLSLAIKKTVSPWGLEDGYLEREGVKASVMDKMVNVFTYGSFLVGGLSRAGQRIRWITDDDEIVSNESTQNTACAVAEMALRRYCTYGLGDGVLGIASKFDDGRRAEDLCAIPDLVAGAISELLSSVPEGAFNKAGLHIPNTTRYSTKTTLILGWLSSLKGPLKKLCCLVEPNGYGERSYVLFTTSAWTAVEGDGTIWTPPDKGWRKAMEGWGFGDGTIP